MAFFKDLTVYTYFHHSRVSESQEALNVGWLAAFRYCPVGLTTREFRRKLRHLCAKPQLQTRGLHYCYLGFCKFIPRPFGPKGSGVVFVRGATHTFAAPELIGHYVRWHWYRPPHPFIDAVLAAPADGGPRAAPFSISRLTSA